MVKSFSNEINNLQLHIGIDDTRKWGSNSTSKYLVKKDPQYVTYS